jgi:hypothetical protein
VQLTDQSLHTAQTATATISIGIAPAVVPAVYVANGGNGTVTSYAAGGAGNLAPLTTFGRTGFGLNAPAGVGHYRAALLAGEGRAPYRWSIVRGALPAGLHLTRTGIISGRPRHAGRARVLIRVADTERPAARARAWLTLVVRHPADT